MDYRLIGLFNRPVAGDSISQFIYEAEFKAGRLRLKDRAADHLSGMPLQALISVAAHAELSGVAADYQARKAGVIGGKPVLDLLRRVYEDGASTPWTPPDELSREDSALGRSLWNDAKKICDRKTIFLVPDFWPPELRSVAQEDIAEMLQSVAFELNSRLNTASLGCDIGFLRLPRPSESKESNDRGKSKTSTANQRGLMRSIVDRLMLIANQDIGAAVFPEGGLGADWIREGPILFDGPTGSGKSVGASLLALSLGKELVSVNIAGLTEGMLEANMRGYAKGAFTGAVKASDGWFARADGRVLFFDEFQNASLAAQTQLLDLLDPFSDEVYVTPMGSGQQSRHTVKVILAVNKPVQDLLAARELREDLYYRIRSVVKFGSLGDIFVSKRPRPLCQQ